MQSTRNLAMIAGVVTAATVAALVVPAPSVGSQAGQTHRGDPSVRLSVSATHPAQRAGGGPALRLAMDGKTPGENEPMKRFANTGSASLSAVVVHRDGGQALRVPGRYDGWATQLPAYDPGDEPPRAAIRVENTASKSDPLSPGRHRFHFGAEFRLDQVSDGSRRDNGDNLVQRGQYQSKRQYKLQVDHGVVLCRVKGARGAVVVRSSEVERQTWYRVRCARNGHKLALKIWGLGQDGATVVSSVTKRGRTGSVTMARTTPLSVGGKLTRKGRIPAAGNDQFNGIVDEVVFGVAD